MSMTEEEPWTARCPAIAIVIAGGNSLTSPHGWPAWWKTADPGAQGKEGLLTRDVLEGLGSGLDGQDFNTQRWRAFHQRAKAHMEIGGWRGVT